MSERTRTRVNKSVSVPYLWQNKIWYPGSLNSLPVHTDDSYQGTVYQDHSWQTMTDVVTEDFHERRARGEIINSPMSIEKVITCDQPLKLSAEGIIRYKHSNGSWYTRLKHQMSGTVSMIDFIGQPACPNVNVSTEQALAVTTAWANADQSELLAMATIAELEDSTKLIGEILSRFVRTCQRVKARREKLVTHRDLENLWMEVRYGLRPMYYDLKGAIAAFDATIGSRMRQTFRGFETASEDTTNIAKRRVNMQPGLAYDLVVEHKCSTDYQIRAGVLMDVETSWAGVLGIDQVGETVYDLVPLSWVFDMFFNIGDTIASWSPNLGMVPLASWLATTKTCHQQSKFLGIEDHVSNNNSTTTYTLDTSPMLANVDKVAAKTVITKTREPEPKRSILPRFDLNLSMFQAIDLAILTENLARERKNLFKALLR